MLASFKQIADDKPVSIHPIVARSVDKDVLEKMRVKVNRTRARVSKTRAPIF